MQWTPGMHGSLGPEDSAASLANWSDLEDQLHDNALKTLAELHLFPVNNTPITYNKFLDKLDEQILFFFLLIGKSW